MPTTMVLLAGESLARRPESGMASTKTIYQNLCWGCFCAIGAHACANNFLCKIEYQMITNLEDSPKLFRNGTIRKCSLEGYRQILGYGTVADTRSWCRQSVRHE